MKLFNLEQLGTLVHIFTSGGYADMAQIYLNEMQERVTAAKPAPLLKPAVAVAVAVAPTRPQAAEPNPILDDLPMEETKEPVLTHKSLGDLAKANMTEEKKALTKAMAKMAVAEQLDAIEAKVEEQSHAGEMPDLTDQQIEDVVEAVGIVYDDVGNVLAISAQPGERGYDPDAHEKEVRILCDGVHIETAHTADVEAGTLKYYKKNEQGRIKTLLMTGKIEVRL